MDHYGEVGRALMDRLAGFQDEDPELTIKAILAVADELRAANLLAALNSTTLALNDYERVQLRDRVHEYLDIPG